MKKVCSIRSTDRRTKFLALDKLWKSGNPYKGSTYIRRTHSFFLMITKCKKSNLLEKNAQIGDFIVFKQILFPEERIIFTFLTLAKDA